MSSVRRSATQRRSDVDGEDEREEREHDHGAAV